MVTTVAELDAANRRLRESAHAVGVALSSVTVYTEPAVARAVQAEQNRESRRRNREAHVVECLAAPVEVAHRGNRERRRPWVGPVHHARQPIITPMLICCR